MGDGVVGGVGEAWEDAVDGAGEGGRGVGLAIEGLAEIERAVVAVEGIDDEDPVGDAGGVGAGGGGF